MYSYFTQAHVLINVHVLVHVVILWTSSAFSVGFVHSEEAQLLGDVLLPAPPDDVSERDCLRERRVFEEPEEDGDVALVRGLLQVDLLQFLLREEFLRKHRHQDFRAAVEGFAKLVANCLQL